MRQNELPPVPGSIHKRKRVGRGNASGKGTYATRGVKGQQSRSGPDLRIGFEGGQLPLIRALSRKRGFRNRNRVEYEIVNLSLLASLPAGADVTPESLREARIVKSHLPVKILGEGEVSVALNVEVERCSAAARTKIEAAGGKVVELNPQQPKAESNSKRARRGRAAAAAAVTGQAPAAAPAEGGPES